MRGCTSTFRGCSRTLKTPNSPPLPVFVQSSPPPLRVRYMFISSVLCLSLFHPFSPSIPPCRPLPPTVPHNRDSMEVEQALHNRRPLPESAAGLPCFWSTLRGQIGADSTRLTRPGVTDGPRYGTSLPGHSTSLPRHRRRHLPICAICSVVTFPCQPGSRPPRRPADTPGQPDLREACGDTRGCEEAQRSLANLSSLGGSVVTREEFRNMMYLRYCEVEMQGVDISDRPGRLTAHRTFPRPEA